MPKTIALERGLEDLARFLSARGYNTVIYDEEVQNADVVIYNRNAMDNYLTQLNTSFILDQGTTSTDNPGALLINAYNKTYNQILSMIERGLYSPLF